MRQSADPSAACSIADRYHTAAQRNLSCHSVLGEEVRVAAVFAVAPVSRIDGVGKIAEVVLEQDVAVNIASYVSKRGIPEIGGIHALR